MANIQENNCFGIVLFPTRRGLEIPANAILWGNGKFHVKGGLEPRIEEFCEHLVNYLHRCGNALLIHHDLQGEACSFTLANHYHVIQEFPTKDGEKRSNEGKNITRVTNGLCDSRFFPEFKNSIQKYDFTCKTLQLRDVRSYATYLKMPPRIYIGATSAKMHYLFLSLPTKSFNKDLIRRMGLRIPFESIEVAQVERMMKSLMKADPLTIHKEESTFVIPTNEEDITILPLSKEEETMSTNEAIQHDHNYASNEEINQIYDDLDEEADDEASILPTMDYLDVLKITNIVTQALPEVLKKMDGIDIPKAKAEETITTMEDITMKEETTPLPIEDKETQETLDIIQSFTTILKGNGVDIKSTVQDILGSQPPRQKTLFEFNWIEESKNATMKQKMDDNPQGIKRKSNDPKQEIPTKRLKMETTLNHEDIKLKLKQKIGRNMTKENERKTSIMDFFK